MMDRDNLLYDFLEFKTESETYKFRQQFNVFLQYDNRFVGAQGFLLMNNPFPKIRIGHMILKYWRFLLKVSIGYGRLTRSFLPSLPSLQET